MSQETFGKKIARAGVVASIAALSVGLFAAGSKVQGTCSFNNMFLGLLIGISVILLIIFSISLRVAKQNETFIPRFPSDPKWDEELNLAAGEMTSHAVPCSTVEHQKGLVDWSPTFNSEQDLSKDPAMFVRQKKLLRPVGDIEKRLVASQRHCGKDGRSDQKPRS